MNLYDFAYIDDKIIGLIEKNLPNVAEVLKKVEIRATGKATSTLSPSEALDGQTQFSQTGGLSQNMEEQK